MTVWKSLSNLQNSSKHTGCAAAHPVSISPENRKRRKRGAETQSRFFFLSMNHAKKHAATEISSGIHQTKSPGKPPPLIFMP